MLQQVFRKTNSWRLRSFSFAAIEDIEKRIYVPGNQGVPSTREAKERVQQHQITKSCRPSWVLPPNLLGLYVTRYEKIARPFLQRIAKAFLLS
jgi:hypothetical protein